MANRDRSTDSSPEDSSQSYSILKGEVHLRRRLLKTILPIILVPWTIASVISIIVVQQQANQEKLSKIEDTIIITSWVTENFLQKGLNLNEVLIANPFVIQALKIGNQQVQSQGLLQQTIEESEKQFASTKLLSPNPSLNHYLKVMIEKNGLAEIILTERNGFNVAYSSPTSDFMQGDEEWWQMGQHKGARVLKPEFDQSTQTAVLELVNPIKNSYTNELLGMTKIGVSVAAINETLKASVGIGLSDSQKLQIVDWRSGKVLNTLSATSSMELGEIIGGEVLKEAVRIFGSAFEDGQQNSNNVLRTLEVEQGISKIELQQHTEGEYPFQQQSSAQSDRDSQSQQRHLLSFRYQGRYFQLTHIAYTDLIVVSSIEEAEMIGAGYKLGFIFAVTGGILAILVTSLTIPLAKNLFHP